MKTYTLQLFLPALLLFSTFQVNAVSIGQITGRVIEGETQQPIAFAEITFESSMDKVVIHANEYGYYYGNRMPTGRYTMTVAYNNRTFVMSKVRVYDGYATEVNFRVSNNTNLPALVELRNDVISISSVTPTDIKITGDNNTNNSTQTLSDLLNAQPGVDVHDGRIFIKGSDKVTFFIDGTPVMGRYNVAGN